MQAWMQRILKPVMLKKMTTMLEITYSKKHKTAKRHSPFVIVMKEADSLKIQLPYSHINFLPTSKYNEYTYGNNIQKKYYGNKTHFYQFSLSYESSGISA